jgi:hypothetical protein
MRKNSFFAYVAIGLMAWVPSLALAQNANDPLLANQTYLTRIQAPAAWNMTTGDGQQVVAVLDTGVDLDHADLRDNIWINPGEIAGDGVDNDGNGYVDDVNGWDFVDNDNTPEPNRNLAYSNEAVGHGTIVAGVLGAVGNNRLGVAGINWRVKIMPLRILDNFGSGKTNKAVAAVRYAVAEGASIINLSLTGFELDENFRSTIEAANRAGVLVVAAVGNKSGGGSNLDLEPIYPACFTAENGADLVLGVAAATETDTKASFSNYGSSCTDLSAPGTKIFSTFFNDPTWAGFTAEYAGGWNGTSIAAPMVSGAAALLRAREPRFSPAQLSTILKLSADPLRETDPLLRGKLGSGRLNLARALEISTSFVPEMTAPAGGASQRATTASGSIAVGAEAGGEPWVDVYRSSGEKTASFLAYGAAFRGGVRLAMGDVDGDGADEIVTAAGRGGGPHVRIFETDGTLIGQFFAFSKTMTAGLYVAVGDINRDGVEEIAVTPDYGGGGQVRLFNRSGETMGSFYPFDYTRLSVRIALGDVNGDGADEVVTALGPGLSPRVRVHSALGNFIKEFNAYAATFSQGVYVATGDVNGDGAEEILTGTGAGGGPHVRVFDGTGKVLRSFFAYDERFRGGVRVSAGWVNGAAAIITAPGPGGGPHVRVFDQTGAATASFFAGDAANRQGRNLAAWAP